MSTRPTQGPDLWIEEDDSATHSAGPGQWNIEWRLENRGGLPVAIEVVAVPHGRFESAELDLPGSLPLEPGHERRISTNVSCDGVPGEVITSPFVILRVLWNGESWRVFARLRIEIDADGVPHAITEAVTTQPVGFASGR
ncbi:MAG: hypothetical protein QOF51_845 [Chloroflexota bacterium]|jgi:hypothetical protein|nr:hypothetical protein [Nocardioidaceae bacterium]MEA2639451.1 hypothetical protein [Chloroflexota bacterium]